MRASVALAWVLLLTSAASLASASCTVNGKEVPCDEFWRDYGWLFGAMGIFWVVAMIVALVGTVFWIWMLIDCANRNFKEKTTWIIILAVGNILGAIIYYLLVKRKGR